MQGRSSTQKIEKRKWKNKVGCSLVVVRFRWERSFDRSYCRKNVGTDGNPFQNSKRYHYVLAPGALSGSAQVW
jgi:hypothetical protein